MPAYQALTIFHDPAVKNGKQGLVFAGEVFELDQFHGIQLVRNGLALPAVVDVPVAPTIKLVAASVPQVNKKK